MMVWKYNRIAGLVVGVMLLAVTSVGCRSALTMTVRSSQVTNGGKPMYLMVRAVDGQTFISENYDAVSKRVFSYPADEDVLSKHVVFPGETMSVRLPPKETGDIGVYFMFTTPGQKWRFTLQQPLSDDVDVDLGNSEISRVTIGGS